MSNLDLLLFVPGREIGHGGAVVMTGDFVTGTPTLKQTMQDIAADLAALDTAGAYGLTLEFDTDNIPADFGVAGSHVFSSGSATGLFRNMLKAIAADLAALAVAQSVLPSVHLHLLTRIPPDFLSGGGHLVPLRDEDFSPQFAAGVSWKWIGSALYAIGMDLAAVNTRDALGVSLATTVTPLP